MPSHADYGYRRVGWIGEGGMAVVSRYERFPLHAGPATGSSEPFYVAVKRIRAQNQDLPEFVALFEAECENVSSVASSHVVHVYGVDMIDGFKSIVMEWVDGCTLEDVIETMRRQRRQVLSLAEQPSGLSAKMVLFVLRGLLHGLKDIHTYKDKDGQLQSLIHRDVSPRNVLLSKYGELKLADFGISKRGRDSRFMTRNRPGTLAYMAPERLVPGEKEYDQSVDLYAVGSIVFELLTGVFYSQWSPHDQDDVEFKHALVHEHLRALPNCSEEMAELTAALLEPLPTKRIQSASAALERIRSLSVDQAGKSELVELVAAASYWAQDRRAREKMDRDGWGGSLAVDLTNLNRAAKPGGAPKQLYPNDSVERASPLNIKRRLGEVGPRTSSLFVGGALLCGVGLTATLQGGYRGKEAAIRDEPQEPVVSKDEESVVKMRDRARKALEELAASLQERPPHGVEDSTAWHEDLGNRLVRYVLLTRSDEEAGDYLSQALRCEGLSSDNELNPEREPRCMGVVDTLDHQGLTLSVSEGQVARDNAILLAPRDNQIVSEALRRLEVWARGKRAEQWEDLLDFSSSQTPEQVLEYSGIRVESARAGGVSFGHTVPPAFSALAGTDALRGRLCQEPFGPWVKLLSLERRRELDIRSKYALQYDQHWKAWLLSGDYHLGGSVEKASNARTLVEAFAEIVEANRVLPDWSCSSEEQIIQRPSLFLEKVSRVLKHQGFLSAMVDASLYATKVFEGPPNTQAGLSEALNEIAKKENAVRAAIPAMHQEVSHHIVLTFLTKPLELARASLRRKLAAFDRGLLEKIWCDEIQSPFLSLFENRYPFVEHASKGADFERLRRFFHPKTGTLWKQVQALDDHLTRSGNRFKLVDRSNTDGLRLSKDALKFLNKAWKFSHAMFPGEQSRPRLRFDLKIKKMQNIRSFSLVIGGQSINHSSERVSLDWPGQKGSFASLKAISSAGESLQIKTPPLQAWAALALIDRGKNTRDEPGLVEVTWDFPNAEDSRIIAELSLVGPDALFLGPRWARSSRLFYSARFRAARMPFAGGKTCGR